MLPERELWACAVHVLRQHGQAAPMFIAERVGQMAMAGNEQGIAVWKAIAVRMDQLSREDGELVPH